MGFSRLSNFRGEDNVYGERIMPPLVTQHFTIVRVVGGGGAIVTHPSTNTLLDCSDLTGSGILIWCLTSKVNGYKTIQNHLIRNDDLRYTPLVEVNQANWSLVVLEKLIYLSPALIIDIQVHKRKCLGYSPLHTVGEEENMLVPSVTHPCTNNVA